VDGNPCGGEMFQCFEKEKGEYYDFSTPWQLDQSLIHGDVVALDRLMDI